MAWDDPHWNPGTPPVNAITNHTACPLCDVDVNMADTYECRMCGEQVCRECFDKVAGMCGHCIDQMDEEEAEFVLCS